MSPDLTSETPPSTPHSWRPPRFMVITAHPDDSEFGPAGTAATWIGAGSVGRLVVCTSGDQGSDDHEADPLDLAARRESEQRAAAAIIGYEDVVFLHQPDGALANELPLRELLVREIRAFRPDAVLASDPEVLFYRDGGVNHADHRAAGMAAVDAVYPAARNAMTFPWLARDGLAPHRVRRLYLFWSHAPNAHVDVSDVLERRIDALRAHASQLREPERVVGWVREWAADEGKAIGVSAAEALRVVVIDEDPDETPHPDHREGEPAPSA